MDLELVHGINSHLIQVSGELLNDMELIDDQFFFRKHHLSYSTIGLPHINANKFHTQSFFFRYVMEIINESSLMTIG